MRSIPAEVASTAGLKKPSIPRSRPIARALKPELHRDVCSVPGSGILPNWRSDPVSACASPTTPARYRVRACARICGSGVHSSQFWEALSTHLDERNAELQSLLDERDVAVKQERFSDAAQLSSRIQELQSMDVLAQLRADQACAVAQQDFSRAAALQARLGPKAGPGLGALLGWWQITAHKKDCLLYTSPSPRD